LAVDVVRQNIREALDSLDATESSFRRLAQADLKEDAARIFFADLRISYEEVQTELHKKIAGDQPGIIEVASLKHALQNSKAQLETSVLLQLALRPLEQNELAYIKVADTQSLTFDLTVASAPAGATVSYRRRGDPYRQNSDPTNTVIKSLPYAIWTVQFQKPGYRAEEREHDPFREPNHVLNVELRP